MSGRSRRSSDPAVLAAGVLHLPDRRVELRQGLVTVGSGATSRLTPTERRLLEALVQSGAAPASSAELLKRVWGRADSDPRVVHTTINRLRQKLGGDGIIAKTSDGYHLAVRHASAARVGTSVLEGQLVGRDADLKRLAAACAEHRLVVLIGPAGVGKSRLVREHVLRTPTPTVWVDLAGRATLDAALRALADALLVPSDVDPEPAQLGEALAASEARLLVLDAAERIVDDLPDLLATLLGASHTVVLVTSRRHVSFPGAATLRLGPLPVESADGEPADAPVLLALRIRAIRPEALVGANVQSLLIALAREVDGLPLALEILARRAALLDLADLHKRLRQDSSSLLSERGGGLPKALDDAWDQLDGTARLVLSTLASLPAAADVALIEATLDDAGVLDALLDLVHRTLVVRRHDGRFELMNLVRSHVSTRTSPDQLRALRQAAVKALVARLPVERPLPFHGAGSAETLARTAPHADLLLAVVDESSPVRERELRTQAAAALASLACLTGPVRDVRHLVGRVLAETDGLALRTRLMLEQGLLAEAAGELMDAERHLIVAASGPEPVATAARVLLAAVLVERGDVGAAAEALARVGAVDHAALVALQARTLGTLAWRTTGDFHALEDARTTQVDQNARSDGSTGLLLAAAREALAEVRLHQGRLEDAEVLLRLARDAREVVDDVAGAGRAAVWLGHVAEARGSWAEAEAAFDAAERTLGRLGDRRWIARAHGHREVARAHLAHAARRVSAAGAHRTEAQHALDTLATVGDAAGRAALGLALLEVHAVWQVDAAGPVVTHVRTALGDRPDAIHRSMLDGLDARCAARKDRAAVARALVAHAALEDLGALGAAARVERAQPAR